MSIRLIVTQNLASSEKKRNNEGASSTEVEPVFSGGAVVSLDDLTRHN